jgi:hypothetical protein
MTTIVQSGINLAYDKQTSQSSDVSPTLGRARNASKARLTFLLMGVKFMVFSLWLI